MKGSMKTTAKLVRYVSLSTAAVCVALASPADAATVPVLNPLGISCTGITQAITGSGFEPGAVIKSLVEGTDPATGIKIPLPAPFTVPSTGDINIPGLTIPDLAVAGATYLQAGQSLPFYAIETLADGTQKAVQGFFSVPNICATPTATVSPASSSSTSASSSSSNSADVNAPTQSASSPSFTPGSGGTGDDLLGSHLNGPLMGLAVALAGIAAAAGARALRRGRAH